MKQPKIAIIGAGFSGLTLAWALIKQGFTVEIFESSDRCGGLLGTERHEIPVEKAANALLASRSVENLFNELNINILKAGHRSNKRYIFNGKPSTFPLSFSEKVKVFFKAFFSIVTRKIKPEKNETVAGWAKRALTLAMNDYLVSPAFQGIYGETSDKLSAELIIGGIFNKETKSQKGQLKGSITAENGMQDLIDGLEIHLKSKGVKIHFGSKGPSNESEFAATILATSRHDVTSALQTKAPKAVQLLEKIPVLPVVTVTLGFKTPKTIQGFGCLFPALEKFNSLGVLFNTDIFANRGSLESETWILNKVGHPNILQLILEDRKRMTGLDEKPIFSKITEYKKALPLYGFELKTFLESDVFVRLEQKSLFEVFKNGARLKESTKPLYLTGNYLGGIGLAKILDYNIRLAERLKKEIV